MTRALTAAEILPEDHANALLVGRVWSDAVAGPVPVILRNGCVHDLSPVSPTLAGVLSFHDLTRRLTAATGREVPGAGVLHAAL